MVLMLVWCVWCCYGACVWCWCSGVVVGGAVVCSVVGGGDLSNLKPYFSLEMGKCCPNFDSTLVVFYMLTTLYQLTHTLCHIYAYNHSILFCFFLFQLITHPAGCLKYRLKKLKVNSIFLSKGGTPCKILLSTLIASFSHSHPMLIL